MSDYLVRLTMKRYYNLGGEKLGFDRHCCGSLL